MWLRTSLEGGVEWFVNNGETFSETLGFVIRQRGGDMEALRDAVAEGEMGVAVLEAEILLTLYDSLLSPCRHRL
ncbi:hypothetical protein KC351_g38 [Hortaea werneckii]|nr:hypothetical protein KC351_g38 [Hortaea werneckii]